MGLRPPHAATASCLDWLFRLAWAAANERIVVTHDISTLPDFTGARIARGERMPSVVIAPRRLSIAQVIEDLLLLAECGRESEWEGRVIYLPL